MPNVCCLCKKTQGPLDHAVSFHRFPKDPIQRDIWLQNCNLEDTARIEHKTLCSFDSSCYISNTNRLLKNAVPTNFPGGAENLKPEVGETLNRPAESVNELSTSTLIHDTEQIAVTIVDSQKKSTNVYSQDSEFIPL